jgi:hypothetical protein
MDMTTRIKLLWAALVLAALTLSHAADVPLAWDTPEPNYADGATLFFVSKKTGQTNMVEVGASSTNATVVLDGPDQYRTWISAWAWTTNNAPGATPRVKTWSEKSNTIHVRIAGKSGNIKVTE